jgi:hypothetical protein
MNLMEIAQTMRMYLVNETGPTRLVLEDSNHAKYKVLIGSDVSCSCGGGKEEHCVHTVKIEKIDRHIDICVAKDIQGGRAGPTVVAVVVHRLRNIKDYTVEICVRAKPQVDAQRRVEKTEQ